LSGFLANYAGEDTIELPDGQYWVRVQRYLASEKMLEAEAHLVESHVSYENGGTVQAKTNSKLYQQTLVLNAIIAWNLDEPDGTIWPIDLAHVQRLPSIVHEMLYKHVNENNNARVVKERSFRGSNGVVAEARDGHATTGAAPVSS
jgi:hypothetical protein